MEETFYCYLCGKPMASSSEIVACSFCGNKEKADYTCPDGHYMCEDCRLASPDKLVKKSMLSYSRGRPHEDCGIANETSRHTNAWP